MKSRLFSALSAALLAVASSLFLASSASAHPLDVAYLDFGYSTSTGLHLTVAVHPYQAYELVRGKNDNVRFDLKALIARGDIVGAYVQDHVSIARDGEACVWTPGDTHTPDNELDAVADGTTVAGPLVCSHDGSKLAVGSTLFLDGFPTQTAILRLELPDGYADRVTLDAKTKQGTLDLSEIFMSPASASSTSSTAMSLGRRPEAELADLTRRLLDPGLGVWGFIGLLLSALLIGALHAMGPGHGKSLLAATLVGEHATFGRALALGTVMTATHVADVFLMTIVAGFISAVLPPTQLLIDLEIASAFALVVLGIFNLIRAIIRYRLIGKYPEAAHEDEAHRRAHELGMPHAHGPSEAQHTHDHELASKKSFRQALWLGFVGSLAPCPTAWAIFAATLSVGRLAVGVLLLIAFTVGLHLTILAVGALIVISKKFALRRTSPALTYALPIISACIIIGLGSALLLRDLI